MWAARQTKQKLPIAFAWRDSPDRRQVTIRIVRAISDKKDSAQAVQDSQDSLLLAGLTPSIVLSRNMIMANHKSQLKSEGAKGTVWQPHPLLIHRHPPGRMRGQKCSANSITGLQPAFYVLCPVLYC
jgi:hypothetical protein